MSVKLQPKTLEFQRPFTREVSQILTIENEQSDPVAFKVKTTAPKRYCVRPNSGRIEPGANVQVQVLLQAMKDDPNPKASRDKFLVQSVAVSADKEFSNVSAIWQHVEQTAKSSIKEQKIRVEFLDPEEPAETKGADTNGVATLDEQPPAYTSPAAPRFDTPLAARTAPLDVTSPPHEVEREEPISSPPGVDAVKPSAPAFSSPEPQRAAPTQSDELRSQLADARAQIQKLKDQLADQGLRQRKTGIEKGATTSGLQQQQPTQPAEVGVPLRIVAALCFLSFFLAYVFF
ncbi:phosphatidylinositol-binding protein scs2 [Onygenales sp. PD_40]|nr:phosphatidylinositol-binding protein scs2 [Onygenales sp. PD_40]KAK2793561.1 phosphatidylinositol-binding protein scs2 [Onygenales sp. PD_12]